MIYRFCFLNEGDRLRVAQGRDFDHDKQVTDHAAAIVAGHGLDRVQTPPRDPKPVRHLASPSREGQAT